jgi:CCR4-NOT transcription complex subunit 1
MSEGIQGQKRKKEENSTNISTPAHEQAEEEKSNPLGTYEGPRARKAALLVKVYGNSNECFKNREPNSDTAFVNFIRNLVNSIQTQEKNKGSSTEKLAVSLLNSLEAAFKAKGPGAAAPKTWTWDKDLRQAVLSVLETNQVFNKNPAFKERSLQVLKQIQQQKPDFFKVNMDSIGGSSSVSLSRGVADRVSPTDGPDPYEGVFKVLSDVGPACTRGATKLREAIREVTESLPISNGSKLDEAGVARMIYFFSDRATGPSSEAEKSGLSNSILGSLLAGRGNDTPETNGWNLKVVAEVLSQDYASRDWALIASKWDFAGFHMKSSDQFQTLIELYRRAAQRDPPLAAFTCQWKNPRAQCTLLETILTSPPNVYRCPLSDAEIADAATALQDGQITASSPNPLWASSEVLQRLLYLSDMPALAPRVRDIFVKGLLSCPEVLLCALIRLQLNAANAAAHGNLDTLANAGMPMKGELMRELIPLFFKPNSHHRVQHGPAALRRLWAISHSTVTTLCNEAWRSTASETPQMRLATLKHIINIMQLLPNPESATATLLNGSKDPEFSIAVVFVLADNGLWQLKPWLIERVASNGSNAASTMFAMALVVYISKTYSTATPRGRTTEGSLLSLENLAVSLQVLTSLDSSVLSKTVPATVAASSGDGLISAGMNLRDSIKSVAEACLSTHPSLRSSLVGASGGGAESAPPSPGAASVGGASNAADDIEEMANSYFQKIYTSEQSIAEVVEMLKRFKTSGNTRENDIFACMIHNLFDEYRFFSKYPEKELRITGILFGQLIQQQLVSSITLGIALRYVLEALRKAPSPPGSTTSSSGKMFRFGMFALEQFKGRLHEWPQYCSHIVQIPHLKEGYADLVNEIEQAMAESQSRASGSASTSGTPGTDAGGDAKARGISLMGDGGLDLGSTSQSGPGSLKLTAPAIPVVEEKRVAVFGPGLGRAVNERKEIEHKSPPANVLDRVQFLINNVSPSNVEQKSQEVKEVLDPAYFGWLGQYLVVKRISTQPNFHSLYLAFLENLGDWGRGLVEAILASVYENVGKLLVSPKITTSTSERSLLKNLGSWLGQITLARNRPILQIMLDCKELLFQGYECGKLIAVTPFVAKILEGARNSAVFRPPNPWVMGLLSVFRSLYDVNDLKMNIKFEVEVLCKNLGVKLDDIPPRTEDLDERIPPVKGKNPDFNMKSSMVSAPGSARSGSSALTSPDAKTGGSLIPTSTIGDVSAQFASTGLGKGTGSGSLDQQTVIPNLAAYVTINQSISQLLLQPQSGSLANALNAAALKRFVPIAVDRAIREIIQPVVERSVNIACITTKEIVTKDFAMESDENKMRKAAQLMVANLAGSLALVTCREPLRTSVSTILRQLLSNAAGGMDKLSEAETNILEQCVAISATDNLELGCMLIEKAATEKAVRDMDEALAPALNARRNHREQTGQPFYDMSIFGNGSQRYPGALPEPLRPKPGGLRSDQLRVYEAFERMPRQQGSTDGFGNADGLGVSSRSAGMQGADVMLAKSTGRQLNIDALTALSAKLDSAVSSLLSAAGQRAPEVTLSILPPEHEVRQLLGAVSQVLPNAQAITKPEKEAILGFSQGIFKRLYELSLSAPLRLEALVGLLEQINKSCPQLGRDLGTWAKFAPFETESQRKLHRTVLLLLIRSKLISAQVLDEFLATEANNGRKPVWVEFSLLLIRTAFLERIAAPSEFPRLLDLMSRIADGRSEASPEVSQSLRKPILRMLEEVRGAGSSSDAKRTPQQSPQLSSSLSPTSLSRLSRAPMRAAEATEGFARNDPPNAKEQVTFLLEGWIRVHGEAASNESTLAQYLQLLQQYGVGKGDEQTERFLRLATLIVVEAVINTAKPAQDGSSGKKVLNYAFIDVYSKLVIVLLKHMNGGGTEEQIVAQRMALLNKVLGVTVRTLMWDYHTRSQKSRSLWDQRPWFRLLLNMTMDLNTPDPIFDPISFGILSAIGAAFHVVQPLAVPGFAFAWLELISNRKFLPNLLLLSARRGWNVVLQLLVDQFLFLEPHLRNSELTPAIKQLYEGTLRVLLVLLHDFPSFLAGYHLALCNVIPENCVQLRNVILSSVPKGMVLPDPFTPNLKIDLLPEIQQAPVVLSNVVGPIESMRMELDAFLKDPQRSNFLSTLIPRLCKEGTNEVDAARVNSLVLYVGIKALARIQNAQMAQALPHTPEIEILQKLMEFDDRNRYTCLNAIANELRYPSSHTHYFSCVTLFLFSESKNVAVKEQVTRVLLERLIVHRPHPWGLLITFIELIKNQRYQFWSHQFTRCATEIEKVFESVARSCLAPGTSRSATVGGEESQ